MQQRDGTKDARITIEGAGGAGGREDVVLRGAGINTSRMFQLKHDYYTLQVRLRVLLY